MTNRSGTAPMPRSRGTRKRIAGPRPPLASAPRSGDQNRPDADSGRHLLVLAFDDGNAAGLDIAACSLRLLNVSYACPLLGAAW
jgi:hypothetical protein